MASKALITGATGLLGSQVLQAFEESEWNVVGTGFSRAKPPSIVKLDLGDASAVSALLDRERSAIAAQDPHSEPADCFLVGRRLWFIVSAFILTKASHS